METLTTFIIKDTFAWSFSNVHSTPEHFQRCMNELLEGVPGVVCDVDNILIFGRNREEHNKRFPAVLRKQKNEGLTLDMGKCKYYQSLIDFLSPITNNNGVSQTHVKKKKQLYKRWLHPFL